MLTGDRGGNRVVVYVFEHVAWDNEVRLNRGFEVRDTGNVWVRARFRGSLFGLHSAERVGASCEKCRMDAR